MLVLTIWPLFAVILLGFALARLRVLPPEFWPAAERLNYYLLFPALLVFTLSGAPVRAPEIRDLGLAVVALIGLAALVLAVFRRLRRVAPARFGPAMQGVIRFNTYLGLALVAALGGAAGLERAAVVLAIAVPLVNVLSVLDFRDAAAPTGGVGLLRSLAKNPLILACLAGLALAFAGTGLPFGTGTFLDLLARGSLPLGLLCVGAGLRPETLRSDLAPVALVSALRLLAMPALAALIARLAGLDPVSTLVLVVFAAIPTAPTVYVLTRHMGGDGQFMAALIVAQTLAAVVTIPLVLVVAGLG